MGEKISTNIRMSDLRGKVKEDSTFLLDCRLEKSWNIYF